MSGPSAGSRSRGHRPVAHTQAAVRSPAAVRRRAADRNPGLAGEPTGTQAAALAGTPEGALVAGVAGVRPGRTGQLAVRPKGRAVQSPDPTVWTRFLLVSDVHELKN